ncbi:MAG: glycogen synthase GlgA [Clostridiaceae bacterium]|nr:glycogen synthase GlgA [Clostridiaceae bacterium]
MKILFVTSELSPLARTGGLGDVVGALPGALRASGADVRVIMPLYKSIKDSYADRMVFLRWSMIRLGWRTLYSGLFRMELNGVPLYFIDNEFYFYHDQLYLDYSFDVERFSFFQRAVLEALGRPMGFMPDILHLNDWHTAMIPCLLDAHYRPYGNLSDLKTVLTIHNLKFQGIHSRERIADLLDMPDHYMNNGGILKDGMPNFLKAGIVFADQVTTVSPTYATEILTDYFGEGLHVLLQSQTHKLTGILNGIDDSVYNPATDPAIPANYDRTNWSQGKAVCKAALQAELGLAVDKRLPLACMITRLTDQKGLDLLLHVLTEMLNGDLQLAILGTGEAGYETALKEQADRNPGLFALRLAFDTELSHRMYAGADILLMPSLFEPCGLAQMIAMRYGTLPVVRETGGLKDTVHAFNKYSGEGNGFSFQNINAHEFLYTTRYACDVFRHEPQAWQRLVVTAMSGDYSWRASAQSYLAMYRQLKA